jgi:hypothetical protein
MVVNLQRDTLDTVPYQHQHIHLQHMTLPPSPPGTLTRLLRASTSNMYTSFSTLPLMTTASSCDQATSVTSSWWPRSTADCFQAAAVAQAPPPLCPSSTPAAAADGLPERLPGVLHLSFGAGVGRGVLSGAPAAAVAAAVVDVGWGVEPGTGRQMMSSPLSPAEARQ